MGGRASVASQMVLVVQVDNTGLLIVILVIAGYLSKLSRTKTLGRHKNRLKP